MDASFEKGDALVHRFDVMHGVEVSSGNRYSLVLWLSDCAESVDAAATPWLLGAADAGSAYAQFLYAEACKTGRHGWAEDLPQAVEYQARAAAQAITHRLPLAVGQMCRDRWQVDARLFAEGAQTKAVAARDLEHGLH